MIDVLLDRSRDLDIMTSRVLEIDDDRVYLES